MKALKPYNIAFVGLPEGVHEFDFELNDDFFTCFEGSLIEKAELKGRLQLEKKRNMLELTFFVQGKVELECDRCLEVYWQEVSLEQNMFVKFGEKRDEPSDEILIIPATDSHLDVSQLFYEFISLSLPIRHIHPGGNNEAQNCNSETLERLQSYLTEENTEETKDKTPDSRWDALKKIKFN